MEKLMGVDAYCIWLVASFPIFKFFVFFVVRIRVLSIAIAFQCIVQLKTFLYWCYIIYLF